MSTGIHCVNCGEFAQMGAHPYQLCLKCFGQGHRPHQGCGYYVGFAYRRLKDGTFLLGFSGDIDSNHWHIAPDGTVLSVKEGGLHLFRRTDVTKHIRDVCPELDMSVPWQG